MQASTATSILRCSDPVRQPGTRFILQFIRENGRQPNVLEAFEGGQEFERECAEVPGHASVRMLSASERDEIFDLLADIENRFAGRGGLFALDSLHGLLLSMELAEADQHGRQ